MLVTTPTSGCSSRKERSLSSASTIATRPRPGRELKMLPGSRPPLSTMGSRWPSAAAAMVVVVVLP